MEMGNVESQPDAVIKVLNWTPDSYDRRLYREFSPRYNLKIHTQTTFSLPPTPVKDQQNIGCCTVHSVLAAYEYAVPNSNPSRLFVHYNELSKRSSQCDGSRIIDVIQSLSCNGVCDEALWPYDSKNYAVRPSDECYAEAQNAPYTEALVIHFKNICSALHAGHPVIAGIHMFESFTEATDGCISMPSKYEKLVGGHSILIIGYDHNRCRYMFKNSWGTKWGQKGYGTISYDIVHNTDMCNSLWIILPITSQISYDHTDFSNNDFDDGCVTG